MSEGVGRFARSAVLLSPWPTVALGFFSVLNASLRSWISMGQRADDGWSAHDTMLYQPPLSLTYHPDCQRKLVMGTLPPRAAADGPDCRRAMTEMESRDQRRQVLVYAASAAQC